ncbi:hypothetical protein D3C81_624540 [compost metagenome]
MECGAAHGWRYGQGCTTRLRLLAPGEDQQQAARRLGEQRCEQVPRGVVGPLQVIDKQRQGMAGTAEHLEELDNRPQFLLQCWARGVFREVGGGPDDQFQVGRQLAEQAAASLYPPQDFPAQGVQVRAALGQQLGRERAEYFNPGGIGHGLLGAVAFARGPVTLCSVLQRGTDQAGLAHAGGASDGQHLWRAVPAQGLEQLGDHVLLGDPPVEALMAWHRRVGAARYERLDDLVCSPLPLAVGKVRGQRPCALVTGIGFLGERLGQDLAERLGHLGIDFAGSTRLYAGMQLAPMQFVAPDQRQFAQQKLVKDRTQCIDIAAPVAAGGMRADLLRGQVGPVADRRALFAY